MSQRRMPARKSPRISVRGVVDAFGRPIDILPDHPTADFMRSCHRMAKGTISPDAEGNAIVKGATMVRAQIPYLVTLHVYNSKFQLDPIEQEWILYTPGDLKSAATTALMMWKRWFKPNGRKAGEAASGIDMALEFPLVQDGAVVEPIDDGFFDECWRYVKNRPHKSAGHPDQPWLFTCLDDGFKVYRHTDRQAGLTHRLA